MLIQVLKALSLASAKIYDRGDPTRDYIIEPLTTAGDRADDGACA
jgi:hypothetical protein